MFQIAAIIPVYCPDRRMLETVALASRQFQHVIVVNDGSPDEYAEYFTALDKRIHVIQHDSNRGKGAAIKSALHYCESLDIIGAITIDADGQHLHEDVLRMAQFALKSPDVFILGVRDFSKNVPLRSSVGNKLTIALLRLFYGLNLSDSQTGLRFIPKTLFQDLLILPGDKYEFELQCLLTLHKKKTVIAQLPIETVYLDHNDSSHFRPIRDSIRIYSIFLKFSLSSLFCFALDIALFSLIFAVTQSILLSTALARVASGVANFFLNRTLVFTQQRSSSLSVSAFRYLILWMFVLFSSATVVEAFNSGDSVAFVVPLKIVVDVVLFVINYKIQKHFIFK